MTGENLVQAENLRQFCTEALEKAGVPGDDAKIVADVQVETDLWGIFTHGSILIVGYIRRIKGGGTNPRANITVIKESPHHALVDGDHGLGQVAAVKAMEICVAKAKKSGIATVGVRRSGHFGAASSYSTMALKKDLIGFAVTNAVALLPPTGARTGVFGTNPISFAIPTGHSYPAVLDIATSVAAQQKIFQAYREGQKIPPEWGLDSEANPTDDPITALRSLLMPPMAGHKGYGLAMMVEVLSAVMTGARFGRATEASTWRPESQIDVGHFFAALDPAMFMPIDEFKTRMETLIADIKNVTLLEDVERVYVPGEIEYEKREKALKNGIPLPASTVQGLEQLREEMGIKTGLR